MSQSKKRKKEAEKSVTYFDYSLLFIVFFMICFGLIVLYSASSYEATVELSDPNYYIKKQLFFVVVGLAAMFGITRFHDYHIFETPFFILASLIGSLAMIGLTITPLGIEKNGARRWIGIGGISFQPCEFVKVGTIIFMAFLIDKNVHKLKKIKYYFICLIFDLALAGGIVLLTSDLSSGVIIAAIGVIMLFVACPKFSYTVLTVVLGACAFACALIVEPYRMERIKAWLAPQKYSEEGGFQIMQSLYSLGSGGLFGKGLGKGVQKLGYIPEAQNDMIFTVICEELGIIGGVALILVFLVMIWRFMIISNNAPDLYGSMLVIGVMAHISVQTILNIAVVTNMFPNTGVTLPFVSYGGSSILCLLVEMGLVLLVSKRITFD